MELRDALACVQRVDDYSREHLCVAHKHSLVRSLNTGKYGQHSDAINGGLDVPVLPVECLYWPLNLTRLQSVTARKVRTRHQRGLVAHEHSAPSALKDALARLWEGTALSHSSHFRYFKLPFVKKNAASRAPQILAESTKDILRVGKKTCSQGIS
eukprot:3117319-Amphidinium_carterae.2